MTITLQQAKRLSELGVRREATKAWYLEDIRDIWRLELYGLYKKGCYVAKCSAYNAEELTSMIKGDLEIVRTLEMEFYTFCQVKDGDGIEYYSQVHGSTLTEALGNKLIHDLENGIITAGEVNK